MGAKQKELGSFHRAGKAEEEATRQGVQVPLEAVKDEQ